ncbi:ABC transporter substrate-binding protein [Streptacidiphilus griseoplanus]|uniref:ABC transporter substrate-binding protein n=1 Tax=Peterkaempfera griseoplana TaxID=66896 RepID=UPI0006E41B0C|nr:ABC transporter substrate-binding protein [Peterkaempfera griseoplana]
MTTGPATTGPADPAGTTVRTRTVTAAVVGLCLVLTAALGITLYSRTAGGSVSLLASWTGEEERVFRTVLDAFTADTGIRVDYQGSSAQREILLGEVQAGTEPDIAVLPSPGELADYALAGHLRPLGSVLGTEEQQYSATWIPRLTVGGRQDVYWVPVKADVKSLVWYDTRRYPGRPRDRLAPLVTRGGQWCVGMGSDATSGWPGTDWIEDILLQQAGRDTYQAWATGTGSWTSSAVRRAWQTWHDLLTGSRTAAVPEAVLTTDYRDAGRGMFAARPTCALEHQASFIRAGYPRTGGHPGVPRGDFLPSSELIPHADRAAGAREVSGDLAGMFRDTPQARRLMTYLASAAAQQAWAENTAADQIRPLSVNTRVPSSVYRTDPVTTHVAQALRAPGTTCYDASDAMPPAMRDAFQRGVLEYLAGSRPLDDLLARLDHIRTSVPRTQWLPSVCS